MKITELKKIVKQSVKEAIQEELKEILLEAVRSPKQIIENKPVEVNPPVNTKTRQEIKESYKNILGETAASFNTSKIEKPLQVGGSMDKVSPNGQLPEGNVSMYKIMCLMNSKG